MGYVPVHENLFTKYCNHFLHSLAKLSITRDEMLPLNYLFRVNAILFHGCSVIDFDAVNELRGQNSRASNVLVHVSMHSGWQECARTQCTVGM